MTCTIFNKSHLIDNRRREKYTPVLKALLGSAAIDIHPNYASVYGDNTAIDCCTISNKDIIEQFLDGPKNDDVKTWPDIECSAGSVKIYHLQKTGQFSKSNCISFTDTDIKESLVLLLYAALRDCHIGTSTIFDKSTLPIAIEFLVPVLWHAALSDNCRTKLEIWLNNQHTTPSKNAAETMQMAFSQSLAIHSAYPTQLIDQTTVYKKIRSLAGKATNMRADKWNPGDVYVVVNAQSPMLSCIQQPKGYVPPIEEINNLFADEWSSQDKPLVSVSLKLSDWSFGGKCKGLMRVYESCSTNYHITRSEKETSNILLTDAIDSMRYTLANYSPDLSYVGPLKWDIANQRQQKIQEKFAVLKLLSYIVNVDPNFKQTFSQLIGFGMSLAGRNPTFFKITGSKRNHATIDTYESNTTISIVSPTIKITDSNTTNAVFIECIVDRQGKDYHVVVSIRTNGFGHPTIEIQRAQQLNESSTNHSAPCGPIPTVS